jgi:hypothetical protein
MFVLYMNLFSNRSSLVQSENGVLKTRKKKRKNLIYTEELLEQYRFLKTTTIYYKLISLYI